MTHLAELFIQTAFSQSAAAVLQEQHWLHTQNRPEKQTQFDDFLMKETSGVLSFLNAPGSTKNELKSFERECKEQVGELLTEITQLSPDDFARFATVAMSEVAKVQALELPSYLAQATYRAFDTLDVAFGIDYQRDQGMTPVMGRPERLYEGAGLGVQTSYMTLIEALRQLDIKGRQHVIDLGSGYGRLGLVTGLLYPDVRFTGYEYVEHRVQVSNACAARASLAGRVSYFTQDLAALDFEIPEADVYYLYDPFSKETYKHVFRQLIQIGRGRTITIAAKAAAADWFQEMSEGHLSWSTPPQRYDGKTLSLFRSRI